MKDKTTDKTRKTHAPGLLVVTCPTGTAAQQEADLACRRSLANGARVVRIMANSALATACRKRLADNGGFPLGLQVSTMSAWLRERWSLYGDARRLVSSGQRRALVLLALQNTSLKRVDPSAPGMPRSVEDTLRMHAGTPAMREQADEEDPWGQTGAEASESQRDMLRICRTYQEMVDRHGLIEPGDMAASLPEAMGNSGWSDLVLDGISELPLPQVRLLARAAHYVSITVVVRAPDIKAKHPNPAVALACPMITMLSQMAKQEGVAFSVRRSNLSVGPWTNPEMTDFASTLFTPHPGSAVQPDGNVRFSLPAGTYAEADAIADQIERLVAQDKISASDIVVCCPDPLGWARAVWGKLHGRGIGEIACLAQSSVRVVSTQVGRALLGLTQLTLALQDFSAGSAAPQLQTVASDLARIPLMRVTDTDAFKADLAWRAAPQTSAHTFAHDLAQISTPARVALDALAQGDVVGALNALCPARERDQVAHITSAEQRCEQATADSLRLRLKEAQDMGVNPIREIGRLTNDVSVNVRVLFAEPTSNDAGTPDLDFLNASAQQHTHANLRVNPDAVRFIALREVEGLQARAVVVCNLNADNATDPVDPLGLSEQISIADRMRWRFSAAVEAASDVLVLERKLHDEATNELRPSPLFEEAVDCYRIDPTDLDGLDKHTGMPADGTLAEATPGEETFPSALSPVGAALAQRSATHIDLPTLNLAHAESREILADPETPLSPSTLESYLRCPLRWFYERRLPSSTPDAGFDQLATGTFAHAVLQRFHELLPVRCSIPRVDDASLRDPVTREKIEALIQECLREVEQANADPASDVQNRLIPLGQVERRRLDAVEAAVADCIRGDVRVPAGFNPTMSEWSFGMPGSKQEAVLYAGALLRGSIDRVDTDAQGRALIVDYKGGVGAGHGVPQKKKEALPQGWPLPMHSQALMYAAALESATENRLQPLGAVYLSYSSSQVRGFVDPALRIAVDSGLIQERDLCTTMYGEEDEQPSRGFAALVRETEKVSASAVERLFGGCIEPFPRFGKESCKGCPLVDCPQREV